MLSAGAPEEAIIADVRPDLLYGEQKVPIREEQIVKDSEKAKAKTPIEPGAQMPANHPKIDMENLPAGHPKIDGTQELPAGHLRRSEARSEVISADARKKTRTQKCSPEGEITFWGFFSGPLLACRRFHIRRKLRRPLG